MCYGAAVDAAYAVVIVNLRRLADQLFSDTAKRVSISSMLAENAQAIAALVDVTVAVAAVRDWDDIDIDGLDRVIEDLRSVASRTHQDG